MRMQEVSRHLSDSFRTKLTAASGEELSRFMQAYCRLPRQQSSAQAASPAEPLLMAVMEVVSTRMERRTLTCTGLSHVAYGLARTGVIPSKPWVADLLRAAQANPDPPASRGQESARESQALPDGPSASRLCYSLLVWGADAGQVAAGWLLQGVSAAMASGQLSASDAAIVFLGTSHLGVQVRNHWELLAVQLCTQSLVRQTACL